MVSGQVIDLMKDNSVKLIELAIVLTAIVAPQIPQVLFCNHLSSDEAYKGIAGAGVSASIFAVYKLWKKTS